MISDNFKVLLNGAIGSLTFGVYHMYLTTNMINENNKITQMKIDEYNRNIQLKIDEYNRNIQLRIDENNRRLDELYTKIDEEYLSQKLLNSPKVIKKDIKN